jgi:gliding motility-associated-like protein
MDFIKNEGQWEEKVFFASTRGEMHVGILADGLVFIQNNDRERHLALHHEGAVPVSSESYRYKLQFVGCNKICPKATEWDNTYYNFFIGQDESAWRSRVPAASKVLLPNLYEGVDLLVYSVNNRLKYDFIVHPGGDPDEINWNYTGVKANLSLLGDLEFDLPFGKVRETAPFAYQLHENRIAEVKCNYKYEEGWGFDIGAYNQNEKLVLDPEVIWSTYTGDYGAFSAGVTMSSGDFLYARGNSYSPFDNQDVLLGNENDPPQFVWCFEQLNSEGTDFIWITFVGGSGPGGTCYSLSQAENESIFALGFFFPDSFPITVNGEPYSSAYHCLLNLSQDGTSLISSTYFFAGMPDLKSSRHVAWGESNGERDWGAGLHPLGDDLILIYSTDEAANDLPNTSSFGVLNELHTVAICFSNNLEEILWCTEIGGEEEGCGVHQLHSFVNSDDRLFIAGRTECELGTINELGLDNTLSGFSDGYLIELDTNNGEIIYASYVGEDMNDELNLISEDGEGHLWVAGRSESYEGANLDFEMGSGEMFLYRLNDDLSATTWQGRMGQIESNTTELSIRGHRINSLNFDACGRLVASTQYAQRFNADEPLNILGFPLLNNGNTTGAHYFFSVDLQENELLWGDYYGGGLSHYNRGFRFHGNDQLHFGTCVEHVIFGNQSFIQSTPGAYSSAYEEYLTTNLTLFDFSTEQSGFVEASLDFNLSNESCEQTQVSFVGSEGSTHYWNMSNGDSLQSSTNSLEYSFEVPGVYEVEYTVEDSSTCNVRSTAVYSVEIPEVTSNLDFSWNHSEVLDPCLLPQEVFLEFTGTGADELFWNLPNGTQIENESQVSYSVTSPGNYFFELEAVDLACDSIVSESVELSFYEDLDYEVNYSFLEGTLCEPSEVICEVNGSGIDNYQWTYDGLMIEEDMDLLIALPSGQHLITLNVQNELCARNSSTDIVIEFPSLLVDHELFLPNVFSPNGKDKNEHFRILETSAQAYMIDFQIEIINRWGQVLFSSSDPYFKWDGTDQNAGDPINEGTYFYTLRYHLDCSSEVFEKSGSITIFR